MSRRKHLAARGSTGRIISRRDPELLGPNEVRRLVDAAANGLRDSVWCSMLGRMHLTGKITSAQFAAGKRWTTLVADYALACQAPPPPRTRSLDASGGTPADPDSAAGVREARRHERAAAAYLEGRHVLRLAGAAAERVVDSVCVQDQAPAGLHELDALRAGLQSLAAWWFAKRRSAAR